MHDDARGKESGDFHHNLGDVGSLPGSFRTSPNGISESDKYNLLEIQEQCLLDSHRWFPEIAGSLSHHFIAMVGEVGEFADLLKKVDRGSLEFEEGGETHMQMSMELTDVFIYMCNIAALLRIDLAGNYHVKREFNEERFGHEDDS
jgi:NTP pyrophosphatase (non-canonical NTP hydrolase)